MVRVGAMGSEVLGGGDVAELPVEGQVGGVLALVHRVHRVRHLDLVGGKIDGVWDGKDLIRPASSIEAEFEALLGFLGGGLAEVVVLAAEAVALVELLLEGVVQVPLLLQLLVLQELALALVVQAPILRNAQKFHPSGVVAGVVVLGVAVLRELLGGGVGGHVVGPLVLLRHQLVPTLWPRHPLLLLQPLSRLQMRHTHYVDVGLAVFDLGRRLPAETHLLEQALVIHVLSLVVSVDGALPEHREVFVLELLELPGVHWRVRLCPF